MEGIEGMRELIVRARKGPTTADFSLEAAERRGFLEILAHFVVNALFYSKQIRTDTVVQIVLEGPAAPPKTVTLAGDRLCSIGGYDERSILLLLQRALKAGRGLSLNEELPVDEGLFVAKRSFEHLVRERIQERPVFYLQPAGADVRTELFSLPATFLFTDHLSMPKKTDRFLQRLGARPLSVGPRTLFASQCVVLVHNELDRRH